MASAHLVLHEAYCQLFLVLCPECKEPILQEKMDEHCKNGHQQVRQPKEGQKWEHWEARQGPVLAETTGLVAMGKSFSLDPPLSSGHDNSHTKLSLPQFSHSPLFPYRLMGLAEARDPFQERLNVLLRFVKRRSRKEML